MIDPEAILTDTEVRELLKKIRPVQHELASELHVSRAFVSRVYRGLANPTKGMLDIIGVERKQVYVWKEK